MILWRIDMPHPATAESLGGGIIGVGIFDLAAIFAAIEIGYWLGAKTNVQGDDNVSTLEGAVIGVLALIVGFTFAMALARFEARRDAVLTEANAIGNPNRTERRCWDCYGIM
jgi:hypothetical protein